MQVKSCSLVTCLQPLISCPNDPWQESECGGGNSGGGEANRAPRQLFCLSEGRDEGEVEGRLKQTHSSLQHHPSTERK